VPAQLAKVMGKSQAKKIFKLNNPELEEWEATLLTLNANQLKLLAQWEEASAYPKGLAISILYDMKNGNTKTLEKLRERIGGKPSQRLELSGFEPIQIQVIEPEFKDASNQDDQDL